MKASDGKRMAPRKSARSAEVLAEGAILLVEREMAGDQGQYAAGLQGVERFGEEEIVERQLVAVVVHVGHRRTVDCR